MARLLCTSFFLFQLLGAGPACVAGTFAEARDVFTFMPPPQYPSETWERRSNGFRRAEGTTVCRVSLDAKGAVTGVRIIKSSGNKYLDAACTDAFRHWRAKPGRPGRFFDVPVIFSTDSPKATAILDGLGMSKSSDAGK